MSWHVDFMEEAETDMNELDGSAKKQVDAARADEEVYKIAAKRIQDDK